MSCCPPSFAEASSRKGAGSSPKDGRGASKTWVMGLVLVALATASPLVRDWALADGPRAAATRTALVEVAPESEYRLRIPSPPSHAWSTHGDWDAALRSPRGADSPVELTPRFLPNRAPGFTSGRHDESLPQDAPIMPVAYAPRSHKDIGNSTPRTAVSASPVSKRGFVNGRLRLVQGTSEEPDVLPLVPPAPAPPPLPRPFLPTVRQGYPTELFPGSGSAPVQFPASGPVPPLTGMPPSAPALEDTERRFAFQFQQVPWDWSLRKLAEEAGLALHMTETPPGTFTHVDGNQFTLSEVMDILNDHLIPSGFVAIRQGRNLVVVNAKSGIPDGLVRHVTAIELETLGRNELASIAIPVEAGLPVAVAQEVESLLSPLGRVVPLSNSQRIMVMDTGANLRRVHRLLSDHDEPEHARFTCVHKLRNTPSEEVAKAINDFLTNQRSGGSTPGSGVPGNGQNPATGISQAIIAEKTTNSLLIRGNAREVAEIRALVEQLDRMPSQVLIQALLVEVELGDTDEFGVELGVQDSVLFSRSVIDNILTISETVTSPNGVQTSNQKIISQTAQPGFNFNNQPLGNNTAVSPATVGKQGLSSFGMGRINGDLGFGGLVLSAGSESISVLLRALRQNFHVDILSRPQIRALDNHEALIQIGRQVPVVDGVSITAVGSANPVIRQDQSGIILKVVPQIGGDGNVLIDVKAEKSAYLLTPGTGVPIFTDATNGNVIEAPVKDITTAATSVSVRSGQTIVLGGMITRDDMNLTRKVPLLGDIPLIGLLFQYKLQQSKRKELLIFLTPHVIGDEELEEVLKEEEVERMHFPDPLVDEIHGPVTRAAVAAKEELANRQFGGYAADQAGVNTPPGVTQPVPGSVQQEWSEQPPPAGSYDAAYPGAAPSMEASDPSSRYQSYPSAPQNVPQQYAPPQHVQPQHANPQMDPSRRGVAPYSPPQQHPQPSYGPQSHEPQNGALWNRSSPPPMMPVPAPGQAAPQFSPGGAVSPPHAAAEAAAHLPAASQTRATRPPRRFAGAWSNSAIRRQ
jgi:type II secretory pathway component GspD/PulD (secretin)